MAATKARDGQWFSCASVPWDDSAMNVRKLLWSNGIYARVTSLSIDSGVSRSLCFTVSQNFPPTPCHICRMRLKSSSRWCQTNCLHPRIGQSEQRASKCCIQFPSFSHHGSPHVQQQPSTSCLIDAILSGQTVTFPGIIYCCLQRIMSSHICQANWCWC